MLLPLDVGNTTIDGTPPVEAPRSEMLEAPLLYVGSTMLEGMPPVEATNSEELDEYSVGLASLELLPLYVGNTMLEGKPPVDASTYSELCVVLAPLELAPL